MNRWVRGALFIGATAIAAGGLAAYPAVRDNPEPATAKQRPGSASAAVTRGDLVVTDDLNGTLGFAGSRTIASGRAGTVTSVAAVGSIVGRGEELFSVDGVSVRLLFGTTPSYRTLSIGSKGTDVLQLERNLIALGYGSAWTADKSYTSRTEAAVRRWQKDIGHSATGSVEIGDLVFSPDAVRIAKRDVAVGATINAGQVVMDGTSDRPVVRINLPVDQRQVTRKGMHVQVTLPDGRKTPGRIRSIGTVAQKANGDGSGDSGDDTPTIVVTVSLSKPRDVGGLDAAPVKIRLESQRRKNVLSVPVNALVAVPSGGYAVIRADNHRRVAVRLGVFANGRVEVTGDGVREGLRVEVPTP